LSPPSATADGRTASTPRSSTATAGTRARARAHVNCRTRACAAAGTRARARGGGGARAHARARRWLPRPHSSSRRRRGSVHELGAFAVAGTRRDGAQGGKDGGVVPRCSSGRSSPAHELLHAAGARAPPHRWCTDKEGRRKKKNLTYGPML